MIIDSIKSNLNFIFSSFNVVFDILNIQDSFFSFVKRKRVKGLIEEFFGSSISSVVEFKIVDQSAQLNVALFTIFNFILNSKKGFSK